MKASFNILLVSILLCHWANCLSAQDTLAVRIADKSTYIQWIKQFPPVSDKEKGSSAKFKDFVFGKKDLPAIKNPISLIAESPDKFMVMDQANGLIFQVEDMQYEIPKHLKKKFGKFTSLLDICSIPGGGVLFTDSHLKTAFFINAERKDITPLNDSVELNQPTGIAYSKATDEIWVVETGAHRISVFNKNGKLIKRIGQRGTGDKEFNYPTFLWIDNKGLVYIVDALNYRVQILDKNGDFIFSFGNIGDATGYFARPKGIATDSKGNIYVVDGLFHTVQIFDKTGAFLYNFGRQGRNEEEFWMPVGIYIDDKDYIYIADSYNSRVQIFQLKYYDKK